LSVARICNDDLKIISDRQAKKIKDILRENPVYCGLRNGEFRESDIAMSFADIDMAIENAKIDINGEVIHDFRGKNYNLPGSKWTKITIDKLGVVAPDGGILDEDLTPEQSAEIQTEAESERVSGLDKKQKETEMQNALNAVLRHAAQMKNEHEIMGHSDALEVSQAWYNDQKSIIEKKICLT